MRGFKPFSSGHSGQMCTAGSRIFVQEGVYDNFMKELHQASQAAKPGDVFDPSTTHSPLVSETQLKVRCIRACVLSALDVYFVWSQRVMGYIESGKGDGAKVLTGGGRLSDSGYFVQPTIFTDAKPSMKIVQEEIFGPVAVVVKFKTEEEALKMANDTTYGLGANVFTTNISRATRLAASIESGSVWVNMASAPDFRVPFGGFKQSGQGKEMGEYALEA